MKKGKRIWNRIISLVLCLVMVSGMFAGMGMEAKAASKTYVFRMYCESCKKNLYGKAKINGQSCTTETSIELENSSNPRVEVTEIEGNHLKEVFTNTDVDPYFNDFTIKVFDKTDVTIKVQNNNGTPLAGKTVTTNFPGVSSGVTDSNGEFKFSTRTIWDLKGTVVDGSFTPVEWNAGSSDGETRTITVTLPERRLMTINMKSLAGTLLGGDGYIRVGSEFATKKSDGVFQKEVNIGETYTIAAAEVCGYSSGAKTITIGENTSSVDLELELENPTIVGMNSSAVSEINLKVGESLNGLGIAYGTDVNGYTRIVGSYPNFSSVQHKGPGGSYTWESSNPDVFTVSNGTSGKLVEAKSGSENTEYLIVTVQSAGNTKTTKIPVTVSKLEPEILIEASENTYGENNGEFTFQSNVAGTFLINGKSISVQKDVSVKKNFNDVVGNNPEVNSYTLDWTFNPSEQSKYNNKQGQVVYQVTPRSLAEDEITCTGNPVYDGTKKELSINVEDRGVELKESKDYTVTYSDNINASDSAKVTITGIGNYEGETTKKFSIAKRPIHIKAEDQTIIYGDSIPHTLDKVTAGNMATGDAVASFVLTPENTNVTDATPLRVDNAVIKRNDVDVTANYEISYEEGSLKINQRPVVLTLDASETSKVYDGTTTLPTSSAVPKFETKDILGKDNADIQINATFEYEDKNVGDGKKLIASEIHFSGSEQVLANYELKTFSTEATGEKGATITVRPLTVTEVTANDKTYDSNTDVEITGKKVENIVESEAGYIDVQVTGTFSDKNVNGTKDQEAVKDVILSYEIMSSDSENYSEKNYVIDNNSQAKTFAKICPKMVTVDGITADSKIYDGTADVTLQSGNAVVEGLVGSETLGVTGEGAFGHKDVKDNQSDNVNILKITLTNGENGGLANNYYVGMEDSQKTATAEITERPLTVSGFEAIDKIYDAKKNADLNVENIQFENIVNGESLNVQAIGTFDTKNVGQNKDVTISDIELLDKESYLASNYSVTSDSQSKTIGAISQKDIEISVKVNDKQYDGETDATIMSAELVGVCDEDQDTVELIDGIPTFDSIGDADEEQVIAISFTEFSITGEDATNYNLIQPTGVTASIYNRYIAMPNKEYLVNSNDWINKDFVVNAASGTEISLTANGVFEEELSRSEEVTDGTFTFYVRRISDGAISKKVTEVYNIDKTVPTGSIAIAENKFNEFLNDITFGTFFNRTQKVVIDSSDDRSGVAKVEYYESAKALTAKQIAKLSDDDWTKGKSVNVTLEDAKHFVYYARITDKAGNQTCISSDGNVYDITNPAITGVKGEETYYTTQSVNVTDTNLIKVVVNGKEQTIADGKLETPITLKGNVKATYTIVATDKAGNETKVIVNMLPIASLDSALKDVTEDNVKLSDEKSVRNIKSAIDKELKKLGDSATPEEMNALLQKQKKLQEMLDSIEGVKSLLETLESLPKAYINGVENPMVIEERDSEKGELDGLVKFVKISLKALSKHEKSLIPLEYKNNLNDLYEILTTYKVISGDGFFWVYDTNGTLTFTANGPVRKFKNALVDDKPVSRADIKITQGSTNVELSASYLYWLGLGSHTFQLEYTDGKTDVVEFNIITMEEWNAMQAGTTQTGTGAATGDSANILLWSAALVAGTVGMIVAKKKRKDEEA